MKLDLRRIFAVLFGGSAGLDSVVGLGLDFKQQILHAAVGVALSLIALFKDRSDKAFAATTEWLQDYDEAHFIPDGGGANEPDA